MTLGNTNDFIIGYTFQRFSLILYLLPASNEFVMINFYADWCRFSNMLQPIFDEAADKIKEIFTEPGRVVFGKVDCDKEGIILELFTSTSLKNDLEAIGNVLISWYRYTISYYEIPYTESDPKWATS